MSDEPLLQSEIILYQTEDRRTRVQCRFENETLWLSQALIAELFQVTVPTVNEHLKGIFAEGELVAGATIRKFRIVRTEGRREVAREIEHYNLDAILAVGFRVRSHRGTQFRQWAKARLSEYLVKGFTMDDERLKNPPGQGQKDYFDEQLERIRDIRSSTPATIRPILTGLFPALCYHVGNSGKPPKFAPAVATRTTPHILRLTPAVTFDPMIAPRGNFPKFPRGAPATPNLATAEIARILIEDRKANPVQNHTVLRTERSNSSTSPFLHASSASNHQPAPWNNPSPRAIAMHKPHTTVPIPFSVMKYNQNPASHFQSTRSQKRNNPLDFDSPRGTAEFRRFASCGKPTKPSDCRGTADGATAIRKNPPLANSSNNSNN